jgi:hypothetical protein
MRRGEDWTAQLRALVEGGLWPTGRNRGRGTLRTEGRLTQKTHHTPDLDLPTLMADDRRSLAVQSLTNRVSTALDSRLGRVQQPTRAAVAGLELSRLAEKTVGSPAREAFGLSRSNDSLLPMVIGVSGGEETARVCLHARTPARQPVEALTPPAPAALAASAGGSTTSAMYAVSDSAV